MVSSPYVLISSLNIHCGYFSNVSVLRTAFWRPAFAGIFKRLLSIRE